MAHFFAVIDPAEVQQMVGAAAAVYGFDLDALAPFGQRIGPSIDAVAAGLARFSDFRQSGVRVP